ncbi:e01f98ff-44e8-42ae-9689-a0edcb6ea8b1 [Sclerotinia trifoliorum]|uniref:E01f98ff-44e8-42ae-9689-a0edcb6ea8b1 n=1 Tax=Sclerotinia trifoliorum TaxID=28548 RepID=A0A8H2W0L1_9HELO|nr:e01f98ff-44e8-42ae-9689-a0edcb6ea8b1 [Sclerotinia trifoliorum]
MSRSTGHPNPTIGPMVRLRGLPYYALPLGGIGIRPDGTEENLNADAEIHPTQGVRVFITDVLRESSLFIDGMGSESGTWRKGKVGNILSGRKQVEFYKRVVSAKDINRLRVYSQHRLVKDKEVWYARRSLHLNQNEPGTANWTEFTRDIKENHARTEDAVSDDVTAKQCMRWDTNNLSVDIGGEQWNNITMAVVEMRHKMPVRMARRTFPVVLITASPNRSEGNEFLVISIPIVDFQTTTWAQFAKEKNQVVAAYASVERFRTLPDDNGRIEWIMATTSDPKGSVSRLMPYIEGTTMPGVIKKDVEMYMRWVERQRRDGGQPEQAVIPPQN